MNWFKNKKEIDGRSPVQVDLIASQHRNECAEKANYEVLKNGDIRIRSQEYLRESLWNIVIFIKQSELIHIENNRIIRLKETKEENDSIHNCIENKKEFNEWTEYRIINYVFSEKDNYWDARNNNLITKKNERTVPANKLLGLCLKGEYKLICSSEEMEEYISSTMSCDDWCRLKLINKMKELNLGDGFINAFADLIGNDLEKYNQMIDLANECDDRSILMYMYTYRFGKKNENKNS